MGASWPGGPRCSRCIASQQSSESECPYGPRGDQKPRFRSRGRPVALVDEPTEQVPPADIARVDRDRLSVRCEG